jgi:hemerythrin-like domain-containing protein
VRLIESRRLTEANTFTNDIQSIKKRVINFERYIKRLKKHVDQEKTAELITELENTDVAQVDMDQLISDIKKIEEEVVDAKRFKLPKY